MSTEKSRKRNSGRKQNNRNLLRIFAGVALILVLALGGLYLYQPDSPTITSLPSEISVDESALKRDAGAFILDVREPEEWEQYHIPGATLIPLGELDVRVNEVPNDQEIVVVCRSGNRSQVGRDILLNAGFNQVTSMAGGINQWSATGYETVSGP